MVAAADGMSPSNNGRAHNHNLQTRPTGKIGKGNDLSSAFAKSADPNMMGFDQAGRRMTTML